MTLNREELLKKQKEYEEQSEKYFQETMQDLEILKYSNEIITFFRRVPIQMAKKKPDLWDVVSGLSELTLQVLIQWIREHDHNRPVKFWSVYVLPTMEKRERMFSKDTSVNAKEYEKIRNLFTVEELAEKHTRLGRVSGNRRSGICPLHKDTDPSFTVYLKSNSFFCFGCKAGGDVIDLFYALKEMNK